MKKSGKIIAVTVLISLLITGLVSCGNLFTVKVPTYDIKGTIEFNEEIIANMIQDDSTAPERMGFASIDSSNNYEKYEFKVAAKDENNNLSGNGQIKRTDTAITYSISGLTAGTYTITVNMVEKENTSKIILTGTSAQVTVGNGSPSTGPAITLSPLQSESAKGNIKLNITLKDDLKETIYQINYKLIKLSGSESNPESNTITDVKTSFDLELSDISAGDYKLHLEFYLSDGSLVYQCDEFMSVYDNMTVDQWVKYGKPPHLTTANGQTSFILTNECLKYFENSTLYVDTSAENTTQVGTKANPCISLKQAIEKAESSSIDSITIYYIQNENPEVIPSPIEITKDLKIQACSKGENGYSYYDPASEENPSFTVKMTKDGHFTVNGGSLEIKGMNIASLYENTEYSSQNGAFFSISSDASAKFTGCSFTDGETTEKGGAIYNEGTVILDSCVFSGNRQYWNQEEGTYLNNAIYCPDTEGVSPSLEIKGSTYFDTESGDTIELSNNSTITLDNEWELPEGAGDYCGNIKFNCEMPSSKEEAVRYPLFTGNLSSTAFTLENDYQSLTTDGYICQFPEAIYVDGDYSATYNPNDSENPDYGEGTVKKPYSNLKSAINEITGTNTNYIYLKAESTLKPCSISVPSAKKAYFGVYNCSNGTINGDNKATVISSAKPDKCDSTYAYRFQIISYSEVCINNIDFKNPANTDNSDTQEAVQFQNANQGAFITINGKATIKNCTFTDGITKHNYGGGALYIQSGAECTIEGCTFTNCQSTSTNTTGGGGAIRNDGTLTIENCTISGCSAQNGDAIYTTNKLTIGNNCSISTTIYCTGLSVLDLTMTTLNNAYKINSIKLVKDSTSPLWITRSNSESINIKTKINLDFDSIEDFTGNENTPFDAINNIAASIFEIDRDTYNITLEDDSLAYYSIEEGIIKHDRVRTVMFVNSNNNAAADSVDNGTADAPYKTLLYALQRIKTTEQKRTIWVYKEHSEEYSCTDIFKNTLNADIKVYDNIVYGQPVAPADSTKRAKITVTSPFQFTNNQLSFEGFDFILENPKSGTGGIFILTYNNTGETSFTSFTNCSFTNPNMKSHRKGGFIYNSGSRGYTTISNCTFVNGITSEMGGAIYNLSKMTLNNCSFTNNINTSSKTACGGAIHNTSTGTLTVNSCTFENNTTNNTPSSIYSEGNVTIDGSNNFGNNNFTFNYSGTSQQITLGNELPESPEEEIPLIIENLADKVDTSPFSTTNDGQNKAAKYFKLSNDNSSSYIISADGYIRKTDTMYVGSSNEANNIISADADGYGYSASRPYATLAYALSQCNSTKKTIWVEASETREEITSKLLLKNKKADIMVTENLSSPSLGGRKPIYLNRINNFGDEVQIDINTGCNISFTNFDFTRFGDSGDGGFIGVSGTASLTNCTFTGGTARNDGGAILVGNGGELTLTGCTFSGNKASNKRNDIYSVNTLNLNAGNKFDGGIKLKEGCKITITEELRPDDGIIKVTMPSYTEGNVVLDGKNYTSAIENELINLSDSSYGINTAGKLQKITIPDIVYIDSNTGMNIPGYGSKDNPFRTLSYALNNIDNKEKLIKIKSGHEETMGHISLSDVKATIAVYKDFVDENPDGSATIKLDDDCHIGISNTSILSFKKVNFSRFSECNSDGGFISNNGTLTLDNCNFDGQNIIVYGYGGIIYNSGTTTCTGCQFSNSSVSNYYGGAIYNSGILTVNNCEFGNCSSEQEGGAIYNSGTLTVEDGTFTGCTHDGGSPNYIYSTGETSSTTLKGNVSYLQNEELSTTSPTIGLSNGASITFSDVCGLESGSVNLQIVFSTEFSKQYYQNNPFIIDYSQLENSDIEFNILNESLGTQSDWEFRSTTQEGQDPIYYAYFN